MLEKEDWQATSLVLQVAGAFLLRCIGGMPARAQPGLRTKGHMRFMIPYPAYTILGAKIPRVCQILLTAALFVGAFFASLPIWQQTAASDSF